jgi:hypothetical protein
MTALDDALNSGAIEWGPHQLTAQWREVQSTEKTDNSDSLVNLSEQISGTVTITHSLDDALPDTVTMTGQGDAAGVLSTGVSGRTGQVRGSSGMRVFVNANGSTNSWNSSPTTKTILVPIPTTAAQGDSLLACVVVDSATTTLSQNSTDPKDQWQLLGSIGDAPYQMFLYFKKRWNSSNPYLTLTSDSSVNFMAMTVPFFGGTPSNGVMDVRITKVDLSVEAGTGVTPHVQSTTAPAPGYQVFFWGYNSSAGSAVLTGTGITTVGTPAANGVAIGAGVSSFRGPGPYSSTLTTSSGTSTVAMAAITVEIFERPTMTAKQWWSQFNSDSPIASYSRDVPDVSFSARTLTTSGGVDTQIFKGQMQGTPIQGDDVTLNAVSKARIRMNRSIQLPIVSALREGLNLDWVVTYLMARGGSFVGPAPTKYTRYWNPLYGSIHAHWGTWRDYNAAYFYDTVNPLLLFGYKNPQPVPGKFLTGMYAQQDASKTIQLTLSARSSYLFPTAEFPHLYDNGGTGPLMADWMSLANSRGRITFWVRGDAVTDGPSYLPGANNWMAQLIVRALDSAGVFLGYVSVTLNSSNRQPSLAMGNDSHGYGSVGLGSFFAIPTDGQWHFIGFAWDFANGQYVYQMDGQKMTGVSTFFATNGWNDTSQLTSTDAQLRANGGTTGFIFNTHVPTSDLLIDSGNAPLSLTMFDDNYPLPTMPNAMNATMRATNIALQGLATEAPANVWDTFAEVARNSLAMYRANELDSMEFLPPSYFGEAAQLTPVAVQDTSTNSTALEAVADPSTIRNVVTLKFQDTRIDTKPQPVLQYLTAIEVPPGTSFLTMPLDTPAVEIHGSSNFGSAEYNIVNLTSTQITTGPLPTNHYITVNNAADGSGSVLNESWVKASFDSTSAQSVVIKLLNFSGKTLYLVNGADSVPYLSVLGYGLRQADAYTTVRDSASVLIRTERSLDADYNWIQDRTTASDMAAMLVNTLARPRPQVSIVAMADPRRKPGQLITIVDSSGTKVAGTWRILTVQHGIDGASYLQGIMAVQVFPAAVWDGPDGWDQGVWS